MFQSTHPRGVRHCGKLLARGWIVVSIHALAWGATAGAGAGLQHPAVSIHAPAWGATNANGSFLWFRKCFNPRTRVGCDSSSANSSGGEVWFQSTHPRGVRRNNGVQHRPVHRVSIHAPAWGATPHNTSSLLIFWSFNPRTRVGCDAPDPLPVCDGQAGFNPRTRVGCDENPCAGSRAQKVSIHAPAWGATPPPPRRPRLISMFQSTHPRGVRRCPRPSTLPNSSSFNPRTRVGCDWCLTWRSLCDCGFQSTHPRGVRRAELDAVEHLGLVSIHAPAWGATWDGYNRRRGIL